MAKPAVRIGLLQAVLALGAAAVLARAAQLQLVQGATWRAEAERSRTLRLVLPARRGGIYDRHGVPLAVTQEYFEVGVAPNELAAPGRDGQLLARALGKPATRVASDLRTRRWVAYPGPYNGIEVQPLRPLRGVYLIGRYSRHYPAGSLARGVVGALLPDGSAGASGLELTLDSLLRGTVGETVELKDNRGRTYESPSRLRREPVPGSDVYLTLDAELQEIAERALDDAMSEYLASGGDIVVLDPRSGELLALASRKTSGDRPVTSKPSFFTDPFEPGSTAKLFTAGALLSLGRVDSTESVDAENGLWQMPIDQRGNTREIHDVHKVSGRLTLADAIKVSSNIAMGKFSERLTAVEQFEALRDFGFGSPTGVEFPAEARGVLRMPDQWDMYSKPSIAMGYEFTVTPIQLASAYAAIANDGVLLTPALVRELRDRSGDVTYRHRPEPVRRAVPPAVAHRLVRFLTAAAGRGGTGEAAQLANWVLAGKTGTAIRHDGGVYQSGHYNASFAAIFPVSDPQLVVVVKIDDPRSDKVYGGQTAAPLTRTMLEEALAARRSAIDRRRLALPVEATRDSNPGVEADEPPEGRVTLTLPLTPPHPGVAERRAVPNVSGGSLRHAAGALHRRGFHVAVHGSGKVLRTTPAAGDSLRLGGIVTVWAE
jgi:cell division protein FtsI (penicillin-binding protein 3)